jgi:transposase InsO family protein
VDEFTRECLAIDVAKRLTSEDVLERLSDLFVHQGVPEHIRSDNGSEFTAKCVREWLGRVGVKTLFIEPGSPWENGYVESFNGKLRDELLARGGKSKRCQPPNPGNLRSCLDLVAGTFFHAVPFGCHIPQVEQPAATPGRQATLCFGSR